MRPNAIILAAFYLLVVILGSVAGASSVVFAFMLLPLAGFAWYLLRQAETPAVSPPPAEHLPAARMQSPATSPSITNESPDRSAAVPRRPDRWPPAGPLSQQAPALDRIAELADVGVVQMSRDGTLEFASRRARELLGFDSDAAAAQKWPAIAAAIRRRSDPDSTSSGIYEVEAASGTLTLNFKIHRVNEEEWSGFLVQIRDRRALDALESDLRSAARHRALNQVWVGIAHDVRGALNAVILNLESLHAAARDQRLDASLLGQVEVVRDELDRLHRSVEMLLRETAPEESEPRMVELHEVARAVASLVERKAEQQHVRIECTREGEARVVVRPDRIRETALILAINALESMPDGGTLGFSTRTVSSRVHLDVIDTGSGIPLEILPRIFELHYTTKPYGTGVGLWAARSIVESEKGRLEVVATGQEGTTFRVSLPAVKED